MNPIFSLMDVDGLIISLKCLDPACNDSKIIVGRSFYNRHVCVCLLNATPAAIGE